MRSWCRDRASKSVFMSGHLPWIRLGIFARGFAAVVYRLAAFLALWVMLAGVEIADLAIGVMAAVAATVVSLHLLPPGNARLSPVDLANLVMRVIWQSLVAGIDVARRALDPRLPLRPGLIAFSPRLPGGTALNTFCTLTSLAPGTLPAGKDDSGAMVIHCLDGGRPIAAHLAADEALLRRALGLYADA
jgi:multicomponent Na+:H+ antiporter subunit E